jgi:hypothetical protein
MLVSFCHRQARLDARRRCVQATAALLERVAAAPADALRPLLDEVFPYISVPQLRPVATALLGRLQPLPRAMLRRLGESGDVFWDVPLAVQRQVRRASMCCLCAACLLTA